MLRHKSADVAQSVERRLGKAEVTGSIPVISFIFLLFYIGQDMRSSIFSGFFCVDSCVFEREQLYCDQKTYKG